MSEIEIMTELKVTAKKPASFYVRAAATFLRGTRSKEAVNELRVSALGGALDVAVQVATRMERDGIGKITAIRTDYIEMSNGTCPQLSFHLLRVPPVATLREVEVKKEFLDEFIKVMTAVATGAREQGGCLRYDLLREEGNECKFMTYEVFASRTATARHAEAPYAKAFDDFVSSKSPLVSTKATEMDVVNFQKASPAPGVMGANCEGSRSEVGCLRFDMMRAVANADTFVSYEVFESPAAMDVHKDMPYVKAWGAFQYGDKKPVISKRVVKFQVLDLQAAELLS
ncbi:unnamed protein product [Cladocopium goreaui]|uniref:Autoinducer 2-degrading protein LsrG n=1 Tax=Cladocopium goreaui TaxID=2562237 RepID=A0A9P1GP84_9DINO|nr:unnamed protein product [Cladocopium goreaui]